MPRRWYELWLALGGRRSLVYVRLPLPFALMFGDAQLCRDPASRHRWLVVLEPDEIDLAGVGCELDEYVDGFLEAPA